MPQLISDVNFFFFRELGLQSAYSRDDSVFRYIKKLMALPFLPVHEIAPMFVRLSVQTQAQPLLDLVDYMKRQWIENPVFTPQDWSVYKQPIRTNNDMEGWHNALNRRAGGQCNLPLYYLIDLLDREAKLTALTIRLVSERKLKRMQHKTYRHLQAKLFEYWEQYDNRQKTASQLLKVCSHLNGPAR